MRPFDNVEVQKDMLPKFGPLLQMFFDDKYVFFIITISRLPFDTFAHIHTSPPNVFIPRDWIVCAEMMRSLKQSLVNGGSLDTLRLLSQHNRELMKIYVAGSSPFLPSDQVI